MFKRILAFVLLTTVMLSSCILHISATENTEEKMQSVTIDTNNDKTYEDYLIRHKNIVTVTETIKKEVNEIVKENPVQVQIEIQQEGMYSFGMSYKAMDNNLSDLKIGLQIDGKYPYESAKALPFPRMWMDEETIMKDSKGNEFAPSQVPYDEYYFNYTSNSLTEGNPKYLFYLSQGVHNISVLYVESQIDVEYIQFGSSDTASEYSAPSNKKLYKGEPIVLEGERATVKSSYFLSGKSDTSSINVTPHNAHNSVINFVGGGNWKNIGETIVWTTPELEEGYYNIGFSYRQNSVIGGKTYRTMTVDGKLPFKEAEAIGFAYGDDWQNSIFSDEEEKPYLVYLSAGVHQIALTVTAGELSSVKENLQKAISMLGELYVEINMITGETVDIYRDYELFVQIPDMEERLVEIKRLLTTTAENILNITESDSGSNYAVIQNMIQVIEQMLNNKFESHRYKNYYYTNYCSVSAVLQDLRNMPLDLDKILLFSPETEEPFEKEGFFKKLVFSAERFIASFINEYSISNTEDSKKITIWVNWGRDQAQVLSSLIQRSFTPKTDIDVDLQLVNATVIQAILSGNGPDCILQYARSEPVNLAMRGVLYDLSKFEDLQSVLSRFAKGAELPYRYKDGLYALPDTQTFFMMFYRKDIFEELGFPIPETWDEFREVSKLLARNNMNAWLPNNTAMDVAQINAGIGSINIFPSMLLQNGLSVYTEDGKSTNLKSAEVMAVFNDWTDYYRKMKFPVSLDFYNRFRTGTTPLGIASYTMYTTLKVAAPEISGLWGMTAIPGTIKEDGSISHISSGGGTGCAILKQSDNPEDAWEFLKWWTSAEIQLSYSNDVESALGPSGRIALSNIDAIKSLSWDEGILEELVGAWGEVEEIPEYPGSYYVARSVYQAFWNVVNANENPKDMLLKFGQEANDEIARKWKQYQNR